jgi:hypothetical protein
VPREDEVSVGDSFGRHGTTLTAWRHSGGYCDGGLFIRLEQAPGELVDATFLPSRNNVDYPALRALAQRITDFCDRNEAAR